MLIFSITPDALTPHKIIEFLEYHEYFKPSWYPCTIVGIEYMMLIGHYHTDEQYHVWLFPLHVYESMSSVWRSFYATVSNWDDVPNDHGLLFKFLNMFRTVPSPLSR